METDVPEQGFGNGRGLVKKCRDAVLQNSYLAAVISAVVLGITAGLFLKFYIHISEHDKQYIGFPGEILMQMVQLMTVPLLLTNLITGASGFKAHRVIAGRATAYFLSTTLMSLSIGIFLVMMFEPGSSPSVEGEDPEDIEPFFNIDSLMDIIRNMAPKCLIQASFRQYETDRLEYEIESDEFNSSVDTNMTEIRLLVKYVDGTNILGLIVWALIFRIIFNRIGKDGKVLVDVFQALNEATKIIVDMILSFLPVGVLFLTTSYVIEYDNVTTIFQIGKFMALVIIGHIIHSTIVLPLTYFLCTRCNPYDVIKEIVPALKKALVSSSSVKTLPLTTQCCESRLMIDKSVTQYMLPIGTNINMDGTALYEVAAAIFITQINHIHLKIGQLIAITLTSGVCSIGSSGIPATGGMTTMFVLMAVGLPAKEATILVIVEWLLDRCNSVVNVLGNCIGVAIVHEVSKGQLGEMDQGPSTPRVQIVDDEELSLDQFLAEISLEEHCQDEEDMFSALEYQEG
ncbi:excitatory amino acid transporter 3-like isoform X2 [Pseudochaenichthys georgianus]|nr:excitatory amino acid transporter 3-like isoform X2 [Pseudochaenichthys georgianus]XP_033945766.1 excitatory amino acid transporter 3-like isoform X2 [Pseudochaenichthys georgianus]XP_033945776.1 excitatory amino acid transporter 3-like isoform X2 [Pseudochaenichthys georgianus]